jgi:hypothetical protein
VATRLTSRLLASLAAALIVAGCGVSAGRSPRVTPPVAIPGPGATTSPAVAQTRAAIVGALASVNLILDDPQVPYRPAESSSLAGAPRTIFQAVLPDDPGHGYIVVYEFRTVADAAAAANEQASYVASGPGRVQFPVDAQFILRRVGTTVVFHVYSRESSTDRRGADVVAALQRLGDTVPVPR